VAALPVDRHLELVRLRHHRPGAETDDPARQRLPEVEAEDPVHALEGAFGHHQRRAAGRFLLGRLEQEDEGAGQRLQPRGEHLGGAHQDRHVTVVTAGVHHARDLGTILVLGELIDRQRVHVRAERDGAAGPAAAQDTAQARAAARAHRHAARLEELAHHARRAVLLEAELGVPVEVAAPLDEGGFEVVDVGSERVLHRSPIAGSWQRITNAAASLSCWSRARPPARRRR
jgi:hypothetical protein